MPPKARISKTDIVTASLTLVREKGAGALNARALAKELNCSTQPIFHNYATMEDLWADVLTAANSLYQQHIQTAMKNTSGPPYKASGRAYIDFARQERELFKLLFMRDRTGEDISSKEEEIGPLLDLIAKNNGFSREKAYLFHLEMWIYVHGIATMIATAYLEWDEAIIEQMLTDAYEGMRIRYQRKDEKNECDLHP